MISYDSGYLASKLKKANTKREQLSATNGNKNKK